MLRYKHIVMLPFKKKFNPVHTIIEHPVYFSYVSLGLPKATYGVTTKFLFYQFLTIRTWNSPSFEYPTRKTLH